MGSHLIPCSPHFLLTPPSSPCRLKVNRKHMTDTTRSRHASPTPPEGLWAHFVGRKAIDESNKGAGDYSAYVGGGLGVIEGADITSVVRQPTTRNGDIFEGEKEERLERDEAEGKPKNL